MANIDLNAFVTGAVAAIMIWAIKRFMDWCWPYIKAMIVALVTKVPPAIAARLKVHWRKVLNLLVLWAVSWTIVDMSQAGMPTTALEVYAMGFWSAIWTWLFLSFMFLPRGAIEAMHEAARHWREANDPKPPPPAPGPRSAV